MWESSVGCARTRLSPLLSLYLVWRVWGGAEIKRDGGGCNFDKPSHHPFHVSARLVPVLVLVLGLCPAIAALRSAMR
ncbi:hypothetical protein MPTK1_3g05920 [Marchantia polymorpha subsp. ruderalis]|nr:hypothetical protein MARPO_0006s0062 [Marchantia polymorpha]BBN04587.1 hypothetical protein Mp_3g05920 [Marchantia polymorpha subsp. ruderalis]|eukprot:PTQ48023.1 hypothetical protein MARPO_0006s0062 [Marchantia polymorpha]